MAGCLRKGESSSLVGALVVSRRECCNGRLGQIKEERQGEKLKSAA